MTQLFPDRFKSIMNNRSLVAIACSLALTVFKVAAGAEPLEVIRPDRKTAVLFEPDVLPILQRNCLACHSASERQGDLVLETVEAMLKGGDSGPAVVPGSADKSLLVVLAAHRDDPVMPPEGNDVNAAKLKPEELGLLALWVEQGAKSIGAAGGISPHSWRPIGGRFAPASAVAVTPDAQHVAVARGNRLLLHHAPSGRLVSELVDPAIESFGGAHQDLVESLAFNREGDMLASGGFREVKIWRRPRDVRAFEVASGPATAIAASPDGSRFATASAGTIRLWDAVSGKAGPVIEGLGSGVTSLLFMPDGATLLAGSADGSIRRWRTDDGVLLGAVELPQPVRAIAVIAGEGQLPNAPDPMLVVAGGDASLRTIRPPDHVPVRIVADAVPRRRLATSVDRQLLALTNASTVRLISRDDRGAPEVIAEWTLDRGPATSLCVVESSAGGRRALATGASDGSVSLWSIPEGTLMRRFWASTAPVTALAATADGATLGSADDKGGVSLWRGVEEDADRVEIAVAALDSVTATTVHEGRKLVATAGISGGSALILVRSLDGSSAPFELRGHAGPVRSIAFIGDGSRIISGGDDRSIRIWDCTQAVGTPIAVIPDATSPVTAVVASGDGGQVVAAGTDHVLRCFSTVDGTLVREFRGHAAAVRSIGLSPNGQPWAVAADGSVRLWNSADGQQVAAWNLPAAPIAAVSSKDGQQLVTIGTDGLVRSHQLAGGQLIKAFTGSAGDSRSIVLAADGTSAVSLESVENRSVIRFWNVSAGKLVEALEAPASAAVIPEAAGVILRVGPQGSLDRLRSVSRRQFDVMPQPVVGLAMLGRASLLLALADGSIKGFQNESGQPTIGVASGAPATCLVTTVDGGLFAVGCKGGVVKCWKSDGSPAGPGVSGLPGDVSSLALSKNGRRLIVGLAQVTAPAAALTVHDPATGAVLERFSSHTGGVGDVCVDDDGTSVLSSGDDAVWRWPLEAVGLVAGQGGAVTSLAAVPSATLEVVTGSVDGVVRRVRLADGQITGQFQHGGPIAAVAVRAGGDRIASVGESRSLRLWKGDGQPVAEVRGDLRRIGAVARLTRQQTAAGERLTIAKKRAEDAEKDVPLKTDLATKAKAALDAADTDVTQKQQAFTAADAARIAAEKNALAASSDARSAVAARQKADRQVQDVQVELQTAQQKSTLLATAAAGDATRKPAADAALQSVAAAQQRLQQMQAAAQAAAMAATTAATAANGMTQKVTETQKPLADAAVALRTAQTARRLAIQQHEIATRELAASMAALPLARETLARADSAVAEAKQALEKATADAAEAVAPIRHVAFSADGGLVVTAGEFPVAHLWDAEAGTALGSFVGHGSPIVGAAFVSGGRLVTAAADDSAIVWEVDAPWKLDRVIGAVTQPDVIADRVLAVDWSGDSSLIVAGGGVPSRTGELAVFQVADGHRVLHVPDAHDDAILAARFSPDGKRIASAGADKYVRTFDAVSGERVRRFEGHTNYVLAVSWKSDGQTLASASADNSVKLWDAETGDQRVSVATFKRHVTAVRFVGDGDTFVTGCGDRIVRLHNNAGGVIRTFPEMAGWIHSVDVTPGGDYLVAGAADGSVKAWNANNGQALAEPTLPLTAQAGSD